MATYPPRLDQIDTAWLDEMPPGAMPTVQSPVPQQPVQPTRVEVVEVPTSRPAPVAVDPIDEPDYRRRINWAGMPGRVSMARWSLGRTLAGTVPIVLIAALVCAVGVRWLFGVWTFWAVLPAVLLGVGWLVIAGVDAVRYTLRGGPPPPVL